VNTDIEYRIRVQRTTEYRHVLRQPPEMRERSLEPLKLQEKRFVAGLLLFPVPRSAGPVAPLPGEGDVEFSYDMAADAECAYTFFVDARHARRVPAEFEDDEGWSECLEGEPVLVPPLDENFFTCNQVQLLSGEGTQVAPSFPLRLRDFEAEKFNLTNPEEPYLLLFAPWCTNKEAKDWTFRVEFAPYLPYANPQANLTPLNEDETAVDWLLPEFPLRYILADEEEDAHMIIILLCAIPY